MQETEPVHTIYESYRSLSFLVEIAAMTELRAPMNKHTPIPLNPSVE